MSEVASSTTESPAASAENIASSSTSAPQEPSKPPPKVRIIRDFDKEHGTLHRRGSVICYSDLFEREPSRSSNATPQEDKTTGASARPMSAPIPPAVKDSRNRHQVLDVSSSWDQNPQVAEAEDSKEVIGRPPLAPSKSRPSNAPKSHPIPFGDRNDQTNRSEPGDSAKEEKITDLRSRPVHKSAWTNGHVSGDRPDGIATRPPFIAPDVRGRPGRYGGIIPLSRDSFASPVDNCSDAASEENVRPDSPSNFSSIPRRNPPVLMPQRAASPSVPRAVSPGRRSPSPVRSLGGFGSRYNPCASPTNFPDYIAGRTEQPSRPVLHTMDTAACPLRPASSEPNMAHRSAALYEVSHVAPSLPKVPATSLGDQELQLTQAEAICLSQIRKALEAGDFRRAEFVINSVSCRNLAEWQRLFTLLSSHHQRILRERRLEPRTRSPEPDAERRRQLTDIEVDSIIYHHYLDDLKVDINRMNFKEDLAMNRYFESMRQKLEDLKR